MKDKLDKKEYVIQVCETKILHYEKYLKKLAHKDEIARDLLFRYQADTVFDDSEDEDYEEEDQESEDDKRVTNVVDENMRLKAENKEAQGLIKVMQDKIEVLNGKLESKPPEMLEDTEDVSEQVVGCQNGSIA